MKGRSGAARDIVQEAVTAATRRPARALLTAMGTILGTGALVATLGLTATTQARISDRFDALKATEVTVSDDSPSAATAAAADRPETALRRLNGVQAVGTLIAAKDPLPVSTLPTDLPAAARRSQDTQVLAISPSLLTAVRASVTDGRPLTTLDQREALPIALIGSAAARTLDLGPVERQPVIFVAGTPLRIAGVIDDPGTRSYLLLSVVVPLTTAKTLAGFRASTVQWTLRTQLGAAQQVGDEAPFAVRPTAPETVAAAVPPDPQTLRGQVEADVRNLYLLLAGLTLLVGAVGIANSALVSVVERTGEIGVRRALGASRTSIVVQFVTESGVLGLVGGIAGAALGIDAVILVAVRSGDTAVLDLQTALLAPLTGALVGLLAGAYPAYRAARITPVQALRSG